MGTSYHLVAALTIPTHDVVRIIPEVVMERGDTIHALASATGVNCRLFMQQDYRL